MACQRFKYTTLVDIEKRAIKKRSIIIIFRSDQQVQRQMLSCDNESESESEYELGSAREGPNVIM